MRFALRGVILVRRGMTSIAEKQSEPDKRPPAHFTHPSLSSESSHQRSVRRIFVNLLSEYMFPLVKVFSHHNPSRKKPTMKCCNRGTLLSGKKPIVADPINTFSSRKIAYAYNSSIHIIAIQGRFSTYASWIGSFVASARSILLSSTCAPLTL